MKKNILLNLLLVGLISNLTTLNNLNYININADNISSVEYNDNIYDKYTPCVATINDNFYDDVIIVTIKHQYSQVNKSWTAKDFGNLDNIKSISDYTYLDWNADEIYNYSHGDNIVFRQQLRIELKDKSKQNVLDMINAIENMNIPDIKRVSPNYMIEGYLDTDFSYPLLNSYNNENQSLYDAINLGKFQAYTSGNNIDVGILDFRLIDTPYIQNIIDLQYKLDKNLISPNPHGLEVSSMITGLNVGIATGVNIHGYEVWDFSNNSSKLNSDWIIAAINDANYKKIPIINCSFGMGINQDILDAINSYKGFLVCSAGNNGDDNDKKSRYPANYSTLCNNVITVANCNSDGIMNDENLRDNCISNFGKNSVLLAVPAHHIIGIGYTSLTEGLKYIDSGGTSASAPILSGVIASLLSYNPDLLYNLQNQVTMNNKSVYTIIKDILCDTVTKTENLSSQVISGGMLNAYEVLKAVSKEVEINLNELGTDTDLKINVVASNGNHDYDSIYTLDYDELETTENGNKVFYIPDLNEDTAEYTITLLNGQDTEDANDDVVIYTINDLNTPIYQLDKYTLEDEFNPGGNNLPFELSYFPERVAEEDNTLLNATISLNTYVDGDVNLNSTIDGNDLLLMKSYVLGLYNFIQTGTNSMMVINNGYSDDLSEIYYSNNVTINGNITSNGYLEIESWNGNINGELNAQRANIFGNLNYPTVGNEMFDTGLLLTDAEITELYFSSDLDNTEEYSSNHNINGSNLNLENNIICGANLSIFSENSINLSSAIKVNEDITINGSVENTQNNIIYSKNGDITIIGDNINYNGIIYAPNGKVTIKGTYNVNIRGI